MWYTLQAGINVKQIHSDGKNACNVRGGVEVVCQASGNNEVRGQASPAASPLAMDRGNAKRAAGKRGKVMKSLEDARARHRGVTCSSCLC